MDPSLRRKVLPWQAPATVLFLSSPCEARSRDVNNGQRGRRGARPCGRAADAVGVHVHEFSLFELALVDHWPPLARPNLACLLVDADTSGEGEVATEPSRALESRLQHDNVTGLCLDCAEIRGVGATRPLPWDYDAAQAVDDAA
jgi:hypothetical protein